MDDIKQDQDNISMVLGQLNPADVEVKREIPGLLAPEDMADFYGYLTGSNSEPPEIIEKVMANIVNKLTAGLGLSIANDLSRQTHLAAYCAQMETDLFNTDSIDALTDREKRDRYKMAKDALNASKEFQRKFILQNKESLRGSRTESEKLLDKLMTLPKEKTQRIMQMLEDESNDTNQDIEVDDTVEFE